MRARFLKISGLVVGLTLTIGSGAFAQTPATAAAAGAQAGQRQRAARPQSPTFARIQARSYDFKEAGKPIPYEVYVPTKYDAAKPTPLIIALHGLGSNPTQLIRYQGLTDLAEERGYIVAAPMGYNTGGWYGSQGTGAPRVGRGDETDVPANLGELSELDVMNVLGMMKKEFNIDPARTYLFGHSMGGGGTWHLGMKNPGIWAALALAAPAIYSSPDELTAITGTPVIVIQGDNDRLVDVAVTRRWVEKMKALGMTYQYVEVPGGSHTDIITANPENMKKVFDFFDKAHRK